MIAAVLVAAVLAAAPVVPARGEAGDPVVGLVHASGWIRLGPDTPDYPEQWVYVPAALNWSMAVDSTSWVEVRAGGVCTGPDGVTREPTLHSHAFCYGSGSW